MAKEPTKEKRVALVIGNAAYKNTRPLLNTENDALAIAKALKRLDFLVTPHADLDHGAMGTAFSRFVENAKGADIALIYFSGHGVEIRGENYLLPVDVAPDSPEALEWNSTSLNKILRSINETRSLFLVILDACRDNPFSEALRGLGGTRSVGSVSRGLASVDNELHGNSLVAYAAKHGSVAWDGDEGRHSPFARALLDHLEKPVEVSLLFRQVRDQVRSKTNGKQVPHVYSSLSSEEIYLRKPEETATAAKPEGQETDDDAALGSRRKQKPTRRSEQEQRVRREKTGVLGKGWLKSTRSKPLIWLAGLSIANAVAIGVIFLFLTFLDDKAWKQARQSQSIRGYSTYLNAYPEGRHAKDADAQIEKLRNELTSKIVSTEIDPLIEKLDSTVTKTRREARSKLAQVLEKYPRLQSALADYLVSLLDAKGETYRRSLGIVETLSRVDGGWQASPAAIAKLEAQRNRSLTKDTSFLKSLDAALQSAAQSFQLRKSQSAGQGASIRQNTLDRTKIYSKGTATIRGTWSWDFDSGSQKSTSEDLWWEQVTRIERYLVPRNGAEFSVIGIVDFQSVSYNQLKNMDYSSVKINGSDASYNEIPRGTVIAGITNERRFTKFLIQRYGYNLEISWVTYEE